MHQNQFQTLLGDLTARPPSWNKKREREGKERGMGRKGEVREGRGRGAENGRRKEREGNLLLP